MGDSVTMMNAPWRFSLQAIQRQSGWTELHAVNDFAANALSVPQLSPEHLAQLGEGAPVSHEAIAVLGPARGWVSGRSCHRKRAGSPFPAKAAMQRFCRLRTRAKPRSSTFCAANTLMSRPSACSGPGLVNLYDALCELAGKTAGPLVPQHVTTPSRLADPQCREAVALFCAMLGTFAGSGADLRRARGVYIMGGVTEDFRILPPLSVSRALRIQGPVSQLSCGHSDLCRDAQGTGAARPEDAVQYRPHPCNEDIMNVAMTRADFARGLGARASLGAGTWEPLHRA
jgi:glucokinase